MAAISIPDDLKTDPSRREPRGNADDQALARDGQRAARRGILSDVPVAPDEIRVFHLRWAVSSPLDQPWSEAAGPEGVHQAVHGPTFWHLVAKLGRQPPEVWRVLDRALTDVDRADPLDPDRWGPAPDTGTYAAAAAEAATAIAAFRQRVVAEALTVTQAAEQIGTSPAEVQRRLDEGELVSIEHEGETLLPGWQFDLRAVSGVLPGVAELQAAFPGDGLSLTSWVLEPNETLEGATPRQRLAAGDVEFVLAAVEAVGA